MIDDSVLLRMLSVYQPPHPTDALALFLQLIRYVSSLFLCHIFMEESVYLDTKDILVVIYGRSSEFTDLKAAGQCSAVERKNVGLFVYTSVDLFLTRQLTFQLHTMPDLQDVSWAIQYALKFLGTDKTPRSIT